MKKKSNRLNWLVALTSLCITGLVAWIAGEVFIRMTKPYETPDTERESSLQYEVTLFSRHAFPQMVQTIHWREGNGSVHINQHGYRGRDFSVPKPQGIVRIVFLGGSAAFDADAPEGRDWPHLVEEDLRRRGYEHVEVINTATPGHATWDSLGRLYSEIWMFEPDYVVVYHAWNDIRYFYWVNPDQSLLRGYRPATTSSDRSLFVGNPFMYYTGPLDRLLSHSQLYVRLRWRYWSWRLGRIGFEGLFRVGEEQSPGYQGSYSNRYSEWGPRQYELNLRLIAAAARAIGAVPVFLTQARLVSLSNSQADRTRIRYGYANLSHEALVRAFSDCDKALFEAGRAGDVPVLDLATMFNGKSELFVDHVHTTTVGSEALAKATGNFLAGILKKQGHRPKTK